MKEILMHKILKTTIIKKSKTFIELRDMRRKELLNLKDLAACSFKDIFGNLSESAFSGSLDLEGLNLNSLEGLPAAASDSNWASIAGNPSLKTICNLPVFDGGKNKNFSTLRLYVDLDFNISCEDSLKLILETFGFIAIEPKGVNSLEDRKIIVELLKKFAWIRRLSGSFDRVLFFLDNDEVPADIKRVKSDLTKFYSLYEKVDFDNIKFDRLLKLL